MGLVLTWLLRVAGVMVLLVVGAVALVYYLASRSLPDYTDELAVPYLNAPVEIVRDNANVPHIFGETDEDVFYAMGYAHAQDRLWQMMTLRRTAQGRLSELFGVPTVEIDKLIRRFDLYALSVASLEAQDEETRRILEAYATGVNIVLYALTH